MKGSERRREKGDGDRDTSLNKTLENHHLGGILFLLNIYLCAPFYHPKESLLFMSLLI